MVLNQPVSLSPEFNASVSEPTVLFQVGDQPVTAASLLVTLRHHGLLPAVIKELVVDHALADVTLPEELQEANPAIAQFRQAYNLVSDDQCQAFLQQRGLTPEDLRVLAQRFQKLQAFKTDRWGNQVESYFLQRKQQLDRVLYSLIRTKDAGLAQEIYFRIQDDGQPFADLAREFSEGQEAQTGGLIGPVELSIPHPALGRMLAVSQPGQLWPPTPMGEWFVIVRLEKFLPAKLDGAIRQRLLDELFNTWLGEQVQQVMAGIKESDSWPQTDSAFGVQP
jgi:parvulin-like peptidyl-prolyl isomerase